MKHISQQLLAAIQFLCHQYHVSMTLHIGTRQPICSRLTVQQDCFMHFCDTDVVIREPSL
jgi:hypothetical protein